MVVTTPDRQFDPGSAPEPRAAAERQDDARPVVTRVGREAIREELARTVAQCAPLVQAELRRGIDGILDRQPPTVPLEGLPELESQVLAAARRWLPRVAGEPPGALGVDSFEAYPQRPAGAIAGYFSDRLLADLVAAFARLALRASLTRDERRELLRGMLRTRHLDARLKRLFGGGEVRLPDGSPCQGKGFRSMGQEAIYGAGLRLRRGGAWRGDDGGWQGDFVAPMIRDLGLALAMGQTPRDVMAAQMGKVGRPTDGKDLHIGDFDLGIVPPAAPITLSTGTACGLGLGLAGTGRVVVSCLGEGGTSSGEWHEVVNFAAVRRLPVVFIVENNQTALSTPVAEQSRAFNFAQKAVGYGLPAITVDGTDVEAVFAAVTAAAEACRRGEGPQFVELVAMRMCGHAHHDDMLYLGVEPEQFLAPVPLAELPAGGYVDREAYAYWVEKDPVRAYSRQLVGDRLLTPTELQLLTAEVAAEIEAAAQEVITAPWPEPRLGGHPVTTDGPWLTHQEPLAPATMAAAGQLAGGLADEAPGVTFDRDGKTFWQAIVEALAEEMRRDPDVFLLGEDVGGAYGNAFLILKSLLAELGPRMLNTPLAEGAILAAATGAALLGKRPVAEIQFNDFVASGFNQLVNNAAKIHYRWGRAVPMVVRLPWGGLRAAGPYHSQNTEAWFYRTPGLKIVCPATPREAKALLKAAVRDANPVLFYEHIALYRMATIKQHLATADQDVVLPIGPAHVKRPGRDLTLITYGAFVHRCLEVAADLAADGIDARVLDLRTLVPLDRAAILAAARETHRVMVVCEDSKSGSVAQSVAALLAEEAFPWLDAPVRVIGALDSPVPYSPPLEAFFLPRRDQIAAAARLLVDY
jgi:2-oxoisovalerate dehydrogenase E1 component